MTEELNNLVKKMVEETIKKIDKSKIEKLAFEEIRLQVRSGLEYGSGHFGNQLERLIMDKVVERYILENYNEIVKAVDIDNIAKVVAI